MSMTPQPFRKEGGTGGTLMASWFIVMVSPAGNSPTTFIEISVKIK